MAIQYARQPIIIMGMARSGTTLISDLLHRLGLFIGHRRIQVDQEEAGGGRFSKKLCAPRKFGSGFVCPNCGAGTVRQRLENECGRLALCKYLTEGLAMCQVLFFVPVVALFVRKTLFLHLVVRGERGSVVLSATAAQSTLFAKTP